MRDRTCICVPDEALWDMRGSQKASLHSTEQGADTERSRRRTRPSASSAMHEAVGRRSAHERDTAAAPPAGLNMSVSSVGVRALAARSVATRSSSSLRARARLTRRRAGGCGAAACGASACLCRTHPALPVRLMQGGSVRMCAGASTRQGRLPAAGVCAAALERQVQQRPGSWRAGQGGGNEHRPRAPARRAAARTCPAPAASGAPRAARAAAWARGMSCRRIGSAAGDPPSPPPGPRWPPAGPATARPPRRPPPPAARAARPPARLAAAAKLGYGRVRDTTGRSGPRRAPQRACARKAQPSQLPSSRAVEPRRARTRDEGGTRAPRPRSPTVAMPRPAISCSPNLPPSWRRRSMGSGSSRARTAASGTTVCCAGLCRPLASLARILLCATPALRRGPGLVRSGRT